MQVKEIEIYRLERIQEHFSSKAKSLGHTSYHARLKDLKLYSSGKRRDRYMIELLMEAN